MTTPLVVCEVCGGTGTVDEGGYGPTDVWEPLLVRCWACQPPVTYPWPTRNPAGGAA